MSRATITPPPRLPEGLACHRCGTTGYQTHRHDIGGRENVRLDCATCGALVRLLRKPNGPEPAYYTDDGANAESNAAPPDTWDWIGLIRQDDRVWRAVALAPTLGACWEALLTYPGRGELLCVPVRPVARGEAEMLAEPARRPPPKG